MSRSVKSEIDRRTTDASKLAALEARKVAILEMVAGLMQEAVDLMRSEGFGKVVMPTELPRQQSGVPDARPAVAEPEPQRVTNPCAMCGQEAMGTEDMPGGQKKYLCRIHYQQRAAEKREEQTTKALMGSEGTMFARPQTPAAPVKKILIQADPLLGNGAVTPPPNKVLDE